MRRVLFVTPSDPTAIVGGGATATRSIIAALRGPPCHADITTVLLRDRSPRLPRILRKLGAALRSLVSTLPSKALFDLAEGAGERVVRMMTRGTYDWVVLNGVETYPLAKGLPPGQKALIVAQNAETELFSGQIQPAMTIPIVKYLLRRDLCKLEMLETSALASTRNVLCLSCEDANVLMRRTPNIRTLILPTTFTYPPYLPPSAKHPTRPLRLSFLARYQWWPNAQAVEWLIRSVLEKLAPGSVCVQLFGPGAERFAGRHPLLVTKGYTEDLADVWNATDIFICPMVSGSGINIKFLEAIYNRQPILATPFTQRGLEPINDPSVLFLARAEQWAEFLASDEALALAARVPRTETAARFAQTTASACLASFLDSAC